MSTWIGCPMSPARQFASLLVATACVGFSGFERARAVENLPNLAAMELTDLNGQKHKLSGRTAPRLSVLVFLGTECPVSNSYAPALKRLHEAHQDSGVLILGVHCDPDVSAENAKTHASEYQLAFPLVLDHDQRLAQACGVHVVPTAVAIAGDGRIIYRGRIDNRFLTNGVRRLEATEFDLKEAIASGLAGKRPDPSTNEPFGCPLPPLRQ